MREEGYSPNNPVVSMISLAHICTNNITNIYILYTQIPCICIHLDIASPKLMVFHVEWVTPGAHIPAIQILLELYCLEGVNVDSVLVRHSAGLQNSIECGCTPEFWLVRSGRHIQLLSIVNWANIWGRNCYMGWLLLYTQQEDVSHHLVGRDLDEQHRYYHAKWDLDVATPGCNGEPWLELFASSTVTTTVQRTTDAACPLGTL